ncbi:MAG TPA: hypothetical protein VL282_11765 [Tepidisphaeraceae bacterium]|nr:hypothetical protein [Tepidisphaeraceae bacterium]
MLLLIALGHVAFLSLARGDSFPRQTIAAARLHQDLNGVRAFDDRASELDHGNVFLEFVNFPPRAGGPFVDWTYFRLAYNLYPRRVFVTSADDVINSNRRLLHVNQLPNEQWLRERNVNYVLSYNWKDGDPARSVRAIRWEQGN